MLHLVKNYSIDSLDEGKVEYLEMATLMECAVKHFVKFLVKECEAIYVMGRKEDVVCINSDYGNVFIVGTR